MVLQDKYKRANSSKYRATHGGIQSNRQKAKKQENINQTKELNETNNNNNNNLIEKENNLTIDPEVENLISIEEISSNNNNNNKSQSFSRRQLNSNIDRYIEPEPDPNQEPEPEIDLSKFIEKQKNQLENDTKEINKKLSQGVKEIILEKDEDIDESFNHLYKHSKNQLFNKNKPTKVLIQNSNQLGLEELNNERKKADATRDLIARFSGPTKITNSINTARNNIKINQKTKLIKQNNYDNIKEKKSVEINNSSTAATVIGPFDDEEFLDEVLNDSSGTYGKFKPT